MARISVIGICGNSQFLSVDHFHRPGETVTAQSCFEEIGGKGFNQAAAAARMGAEVTFLAAVGDDLHGERCQSAAQDCGICGHFAVKPGQRTTFAVILTDRNGENRVTVSPGAELCPEDVRAFEQEIAASDILLLQQEVPAPVNELAAQLAQKHGVRVVLNPAPIRPLSQEMADRVFLVTPNQQEQEGLRGLHFSNCVTTLGGDGCLINSRERIPAAAVNAVDTTGAGDTFNGILAVCLAEGMSLTDACRFAVAGAGISVTRPGVLCAIPTREETERTVLL